MLGGSGRRYELSEVLAEELKAIHGAEAIMFAAQDRTRRPFEAALAAAEAEARAGEAEVGKKDAAAERARRRVVYDQARQLDLAAFCLSGGGIRSASVSLGVLQALVDKNLLRQFHYLSTVSGGGYIGAWLSAWLHHSGNAEIVIEQLREERSNPDSEPPPLAHLRRYSNYLTPRLGVFSADTWAAVAIVLRNLVVNWLILLPAIALVVVAVKLVAAVLIAPDGADPATVFVALACLFVGWIGLGYKFYRLYSPTPNSDTAIAQSRFIQCSLVPAVVGGLGFVWLLMRDQTPVSVLAPDMAMDWLRGQLNPAGFDLLFGGHRTGLALGRVFEFALAVFIGALLVSYLNRRAFSGAPPPRGPVQPPRRMGLLNAAAWLAAVLVFGVMIWGGIALFWNGDPAPAPTVKIVSALCVKDAAPCAANPAPHAMPVTLDRSQLMVIFGMPFFLLATVSAHAVYLLLRSGSGTGDVEREWLGRASGWHFIAGLGWIIVSAIVLLGPTLYYNEHLIGQNAGAWLSSLTAASGALVAFLGKSGLTPAKGQASGLTGIGSNVALAIAAPLFAILLLILISVLLDWSLAGRDHACFVKGQGVKCAPALWLAWAAGLVLLLAIVDRLANVNRFSIHALYRNRLIRAYLGAAREPSREPDGFTDFDWCDNVRMADLWDDRRPVDQGANWRPFHVVNMTLNLASSKNLAWQQRKGSSFTVTPQSCGNADLGYRRTDEYGGPVDDGSHTAGITLGTAMAISGAAISSNMGYHSSPALSFLLTLFNVRLGWWLGNPGKAGEKKHWWQNRDPFREEGPQFALRPLLSELFGLTSAESAYVYLSDGGHFEDLGLYEMVRRRCKWIVVCDDDQDGKRGFADLGNAVRKIWIDLGIRISFPDAPLLQAGAETKAAEIPYFALGTIDYVSDGHRRLPPGKLLYVKPGVRGDEEAADIIAYQRANPDFPAQTTGDQWFDEAQLEAYRRLGYLMMCRMISGAASWRDPRNLDELFAGLANIDPKTMAARVRR